MDWKRLEIPKEDRDDWIKALRDGHYKQGKDQLKDYTIDNEPVYCCLGVMCDLKNIDLEDSGVNEGKGLGSLSYPSDLHSESGVPDWLKATSESKQARSLQRMYMKGEIEKYNKHVTYPNFVCMLALMNDDDYSFERIADIIEELTIGV